MSTDQTVPAAASTTPTSSTPRHTTSIITVPANLTIEEAIERAKITQVSPQFTSKYVSRGPLAQEQFRYELNPLRLESTGLAMARLSIGGYRPGNVHHLLAMFMDNPNLGRETPIMAFGTQIDIEQGNKKIVPAYASLDYFQGKPRLRFRSDERWSSGLKALMVRS